MVREERHDAGEECDDGSPVARVAPSPPKDFQDVVYDFHGLPRFGGEPGAADVSGRPDGGCTVALDIVRHGAKGETIMSGTDREQEGGGYAA